MEIVFYSRLILPDHWKTVFAHMFKTRITFLDFLDLSHIIPLNRCNIVIGRYDKTVRFFIKDNGKLRKLAPLLFPFSFRDGEPEKQEETRFPRGIFLITRTNVLDFIMKEDLERIELTTFSILNRTLGIGKTVDENGTKKIFLTTNPAKFLQIDMEKNPAFYIEVMHHPRLKAMHVSSSKPLFEKEGTTIGVDNFDIYKHSLIAGMSGTGKSKSIVMMVNSIARAHSDARIIVLDPHAELKDSITHAKVVDFTSNYIEPLETGGETSPLTIQLIVNLVSSIMASKNNYAERVLFYAVHLLSQIGKLTLLNIGVLLTDPAKRMEFVIRTKNEEVKRFFSTEFEKVYIHHFNDAILPILNFIGQYELYMGEEKEKEKLLDLLEKNRTTVVSFNPNFFGRQMIKFFGGAIIQQMYTLAITRCTVH